IDCQGTITESDFYIPGDATALSGVTCIAGSLRIESELTELDEAALSSLQWIGGDLTVVQAVEPSSLRGLRKLTTVHGSVKISANTLTTLTGLEKLTTAGGAFDLSDNGALEQVDALAMLASVGGELWIVHNAALDNLDGLSALRTVGSFVFILENGSPASRRAASRASAAIYASTATRGSRT
ncbi:MAG TPA: hypothetical protein VK509_04705, partial [Polyangiales bacterium]|nr:hypothetical protein [Polyangiales bacterium]